MKNETIQNALSILRKTLENGYSISKNCVLEGYANTYVKNVKIKILSKDPSERTDEENEVLFLYAENSGKTTQENSPTQKNLDIDEKYDNRSKSWPVVDENKKITHYEFEILVRDERPFKGTISRDQMELIHANYPYMTLNSLSQLLPYFTFVQLKRILRVFNITKDKYWPPHLLSEIPDDQLAELGLKNKENSAYKKFAEKKNSFYEGQLRITQAKLFEIQNDRKYYHELVENTLDNFYKNKPEYKELRFQQPYKQSPQNNDSLYFTFGDIHFGKCFDGNVFGRGVNKEILRERCLAISDDVVLQANTYKSGNIYLNILGDIFESIIPDGMHHEHFKTMDLIGDQQMEFALNVFEEMMENIQSNIKHNFKLFIFGIGGNHDRIGEKREQDKRRTASAIFFIMLAKIFKLKGYDNVSITEPEDGIVRYANDGLSFIGFHGDSPLFKSSAIDIMNLFKEGDSRNYTVILNGHWHSNKITEGVNYKRIVCGSVCSADAYIQNEIGKGSQPSYLFMKKSKGYGVDIEIKTLY